MNTTDILNEARRMLSRDCFENYKCADDVAESIVSDLEARFDVSADCAASIGELCGEWFASES